MNAAFLHHLPADLQRNVRSYVDYDLAPRTRVNVYDVNLSFGISIDYLFRTTISEARVLDDAPRHVAAS